MQKFAQKRTFLNKMREMVNVSGKVAEEYFKPQFKALLNNIRKRDDTIRSIVAGEKLGDSAISSQISMKELLKSAKTNFNRREFMTALSYLGKFHEEIVKVVAEIKAIDENVDEVHDQFLFEELKNEHKVQLMSFHNKFKQANARYELIKEAGKISDFFYSLSQRGRALSAWEKRYPKEVGKFKDGISELIDKSQGLYSTIIASLKDMAKARSVRHPGDYMSAAKDILAEADKYENGKGGFKEFYKNVLAGDKGWLAKMDRYFNKLDDKPINEAPKVAPEKIPTAPDTEPQIMTFDVEKPKSSISETKEQNKPIIPAKPPMSQVLSGGSADPNAKPSKPPAKKSHQNFIHMLESLANESLPILSSCIIKYANNIKLSDPIVSKKLLTIANNIRK